jgi:prevent-host-death family protein
MRTVNISEAKKYLSRLVDRAAKGEPFIIAKAGKPLVEVVPLNAPPAGEIKRLGFMPGIEVPNDFDTMFAEEIEEMFYRDEDK